MKGVTNFSEDLLLSFLIWTQEYYNSIRWFPNRITFLCWEFEWLKLDFKLDLKFRVNYIEKYEYGYEDENEYDILIFCCDKQKS